MLIDAGTRWTTGRTLKQLRGRKMALMALTHVHPDHQGAAAAVCQTFQIPLACHGADADVMEGKQPMVPSNLVVRLGHRLLSGPIHPVDRRWQGGEILGDWQVIPTPGHTLGHVIFWRESDRTVISGDVFRNSSFHRGVGQLGEPPSFFSVDPMLNRKSLRLLANSMPSGLVCPGHGACPFHDTRRSGEIGFPARCGVSKPVGDRLGLMI